MTRILAIALFFAVLFASVQAGADMLLLNAGQGSAGGGAISTTGLTNDAASLNLTDDAGTNSLVAQ